MFSRTTAGMRTLALGLLISAAAIPTAGPAVAGETWDMPMAYAASNFHSETGAAFAQCITTGTGGDLEVVTHPSGALFSGADIKRAVQTGQVPIGERLLSAHQNENPLFGFDSIPFLATSFEDSAALWQAARPTIDQVLADQNLVLLYAVPWPPQGLYFNKAVDSVADMAGVKFRSYNTTTARLAELTGMLPVQIEAAEISQAFATGVVESMMSSGATGYDRKVWESLSHFYTADASLPRNYVFANADAWDGLDDATRDVITACADLAEYAGTARAMEYTTFTVTGLTRNGMTVTAPGDALTAELAAIGETMTAEWLEAAGDDGRAIVDAFKARP
ncbi:TRAP transporter substrate-binding protein [Roseospira visakhapatnamensis]|uniref:TRAP-type C4-dicarboxylate transport system substrate-binding protein n=1 Tax=Roseospira visakhapatnamensis TaxID=390880 RepID=A0A7W6RAK5_9PROT|nr:TRAP transporter substrate-binding protein [Roseospira visakhapatnamensis]MBB4264937.1 TRAP-type C4-dicarboxylate transport system substrate-binding protein [Roseospira visakhapatnamensis]